MNDTDLLVEQIREFDVNLRAIRKLVTSLMFRLGRLERALNLGEIGENGVEVDVSGSPLVLLAESIEILEGLRIRLHDEGKLE